MTETAEAMRYRADVPGRAKEAIVQKKETMVSRARGMVDRVVGAMPEMPTTDDVRGAVPGWVPDGQQIKGTAQEAATQVRQGASQAVSVAQSNPIGLALGAIAVGFVAGLAAPVSRMEHERLGELGDQIRDQAKQAGQQALEHGKQVVQETAQTAAETAKEVGQQHGEELAQSVREGASEIRTGSST